jgi:choline-glycine betaine transporter
VVRLRCRKQRVKEWLVDYFLYWIGLALVVGIAAGHRGRSGVGWFFLSLLISPLLGGLLFLAVGGKAVQQPVVLDASGQTITGDTHMRCPECREIVRRDARKCKHCGAALSSQ